MYRTVDTATWADEWIQTLPAHARYLFLYLLTNHRATACGAFELTLGAAARETGLTRVEVESALAALAPKVRYWPDYDVVWVQNFYKRQRANSNKENFKTSARHALQLLPPCVQQAVWGVYPELRPEEQPTPDPSKRPAPQPATNPISQPSVNGIDDGIRQPIADPIAHKENSNRDQITGTVTESEDHARTRYARDTHAIRTHEDAQRAAFDRDLPSASTTRPPGAPIDRPPTPAFKPSDNPDVRAFVADQFLPVYPLRDGKLRSPEKLYAAVAGVPRPRWPDLVTGAGYYADSIDAADGKTKDPHNWINDGDWEEWAKGPASPRLPKGSSHERSRYESPAERRERETFESIASIYGTPAGHYGRDRQEPPALPDGAVDARVIDLDRRRVGGDVGRDPDGLAGARVPGRPQWATG